MFAEPPMPDRQPSPGLSLNLSSNNPFRNRAASPALQSPASATRSSSSSRPMSRNPFLSTFEAEFNKEAQKTDRIDMSATLKDSPKRATFGPSTDELFKNLTIEDENKRRAPPPRPAPNRSGTDPRAGHRPSRSDEEERERQRGQPRGPPRQRGQNERPNERTGERTAHHSSPDRRERRTRRNSEGSMIDKGSLDASEERRRRERRKERDAAKPGQKRVRKPQGLDLIDKLDVTGIYGPSMIHHDGPYDAVQPHRNRKKDVRAPMEAFPVGSANNSLGGSGPLNSKIDLDRVHGRGAEGFSDFGAAANEWRKPSARTQTEFSATARVDMVHGEQSHGLGTSTFLEGAPASRKAIEEETEAQKRAMMDGGLGRKKSIAQRFRGISQPRRYGDGPRITSPEARYGTATSPTGPYSAGPISQTKATEQNPFFSEDYDRAYEAKGASIQATETGSRPRPSSPARNALHRSITSDSIGSPQNEPKSSGGFLNRVKSLKGGRRRPA